MQAISSKNSKRCIYYIGIGQFFDEVPVFPCTLTYQLVVHVKRQIGRLFQALFISILL